MFDSKRIEELMLQLPNYLRAVAEVLESPEGARTVANYVAAVNDLIQLFEKAREIHQLTCSWDYVQA
jgi:hypothetical protein